MVSFNSYEKWQIFITSDGDYSQLIAADFVNQYAIKLLLNEGLDPNLQNIYEKTPLILLAGRGSIPTDLMVELVGLLKDAGANLENSEGFA
ncbi:hypothetical protein R50345_15975 [Paenibacillus sp. FSL R5-0345]|uniref:hypothetical protein n=1 Tax=Paenibacillus sp. FSL R5-0345 TaxID=1536770 RepID=UPI0004F8F5C0|nr:hypothetical protein [Paenibacillus sp. FSL R5-0345]AIQ35984.1 hypothetical protein R50345_15975 [Paenibacillus sp. FSL R5-0345]